MKFVLLVLLGVVCVYFGYDLYKWKHKNVFKDNVNSMIYLLKSELEQINNELDKSKPSEADRVRLLNRKNKLESDLKLFYGV